MRSLKDAEALADVFSEAIHAHDEVEQLAGRRGADSVSERLRSGL